MEKENKKQLNIPKLHFLGFDKKWLCGEIKDIGEVIGGGTPDTTILDYWGGDINWFTPTEIKQKYISESSRKISKIGLNKSSAKLLPPGTLLLTTRATVGDVSISNLESSTNQGFQSILVNKDNINEFFYYWILKNKNKFLKLANGSTFPEISGKEVKKIKIIYPEREEQQKIADFLSTIDNWINNLKQQKENLWSYKKGIMQKIFSQEIRFKDANGINFAEWEKKKLKNIAKIYDGTHQTPKYLKEGIPFYSVEHLTANNFNNTKFISRDIFEKENKKVKIEKNDILMTRIGDIGTARLIDWDVNASFYVSLALIKQSEKINSKYLSKYISSISFKKELWKRTIHVAFPKKINLGEIGESNVLVPSIHEQQKIADFLSSIDDLIELKENKINETENWKKGLMQQMFI